jgi:hypothetical protein
MDLQGNSKNNLHSLIPLDDFKAILSIDDREDKTARFCLVTATLTIEQFCRRKLLRKKHFERIEFFGDLLLPLREFPVSKILAVYLLGDGEILEPDFYRAVPDCGCDYDLQFAVELSPALKRYRNLKAIKAVYWAGYAPNSVPADLSSACLELANWNMNRYKGRRIGITGNVRGSKDGERAASVSFEVSMPENVKNLLEPYRRKTI